VLKWASPPAIGKARVSANPSRSAARFDFVSILGELRRKPKQWSLMVREWSPEFAAGRAGQLRDGRLGGQATPGKYEFVSRGTGVYGRYLGRAGK
jgi:hypothetical protein